MHSGQKQIVENLTKAVKNYEGSISAMKELARWQTIMRKIEDITNSDGEHDSDYSAVCDRVNALAREALWVNEQSI